MARLFVALELPDDLKQELIRLQPAAERGVRLTRPEQMHATLHFLGDMEPEPVAAALATVRSPAFSLSFSGVGQFAKRRGPTVLWAGIAPSEGLSALYAATGAALQPTGYVAEKRPYAPHITLARCEPGTPQRLIQDFLTRHAAWAAADIMITEFKLYSSQLTANGSIHTCLETLTLDSMS